MNRPVEVNIGELVLHGFPAGRRRVIADAFRAEMARLLAERGVPPALAGSVPPVDAGTYSARPHDGPQAIGAAIARSVYGGLSR